MQTNFDPYYHWLGIWPHEQPADHYRLLGVAQFESDLGAIAAAAEQRMAHVHSFQLSPQAAWSQRLLSELAMARLVLLEPARKGAYDAVLRLMTPAVIANPQPWGGPQPVAMAAPTNAPAWPVEAVRPVAPPNFPAVAPPPFPTAPVAETPRPTPVLKPSTGPAPIPIAPKPQAGTVNKAAAGELAAGAMVGHYRILEKVSSSSLGCVYKVQDTQGGRLFFLKNLPAAARTNAEVQKRFQREIEIITKLDHPNLIAGRESGTHNGDPYLIMDYVLGTDLGTLVQQQGRLTVHDAVEYLAQTARGLLQLHSHGIYHRNLKPQVLLVDVQGNVRITNLLLAKIGESSTMDGGDEALTTQGEQMGTFDYLPPEQATDARSVDGRSDIYSLGCTLFYFLIGRPPYIAKKPMEKLLAHRQAPIPSLRNLRDDVPEWLDKVFQTMLAKHPAQRMQSVAELIENLEHKKTTVASTRNQPPSPPWWRKALSIFGLGRG